MTLLLKENCSVDLQVELAPRKYMHFFGFLFYKVNKIREFKMKTLILLNKK